MRKIVCLAVSVFIVFFQASAFAQSGNDDNLAPFYELINTLIVSNSDGETGIELVFRANQLPPGGLWGDVIKRDTAILCKTWAKAAIDNAKTVTDVMEINFITVQMRSGGAIGLYTKRLFMTDGQYCL